MPALTGAAAEGMTGVQRRHPGRLSWWWHWHRFEHHLRAYPGATSSLQGADKGRFRLWRVCCFFFRFFPCVDPRGGRRGGKKRAGRKTGHRKKKGDHKRNESGFEYVIS